MEGAALSSRLELPRLQAAARPLLSLSSANSCIDRAVLQLPTHRSLAARSTLRVRLGSGSFSQPAYAGDTIHAAPLSMHRCFAPHSSTGSLLAAVCRWRRQNPHSVVQSLVPCFPRVPSPEAFGRRPVEAVVVLYLMEEKGVTAHAISDLLYHASGLLGVSGISNDMRTLLASADTHAKEAVELFVYRICREAGSLAAALGGLDALVFTAGIGQHAAEIRRRVCEQARWLGFEIDQPANSRGGAKITKEGAEASAWVIPTDEELMIACHCWALLQPQPSA